MKNKTKRTYEYVKQYQNDELPEGLSDKWDFANQLIDSLELELAIQKLTKEEQEIVLMVKEGYTQREIEKKLVINHRKIRATLDKLLNIIR